MKKNLFRVLLCLLSLSINSFVFAKTQTANNTEQYLSSIQNDPTKLFQFLKAMPKGGDIHIHEAGASLPENLINYAYSDNLCIDRKSLAVSINAGCATNNLFDDAIQDPTFYRSVVEAWSMQDFVAGKESGHDHFFNVFSKVGLITGAHHGDIESELTERAGLENESYIELMVTPDANKSGELGAKLGWNDDFSVMRQQLLAADFNHILNIISQSLDQDEQRRYVRLKCGSLQPEAGCKVTVRFLYQVLREQAPEKVFAQLLAGFESASKDPRIVGINIVQPEDGTISMRDYKLHMQMIGYLHKLYPKVHISLHAGEITSDLVDPEGLRFHINDAIHVAHADRIGHGVDITSEENYENLLKWMAKNHNLVEINLISNADILGVKGKNHPILVYMNYGVPLTLSTDDEGITRANLTKGYEHAETEYHFTYATLKTFARNSIYYSFLAGNNLWLGDDYRQVVPECSKDTLGAITVSLICKTFLDANEKANMQWDLEKRFTQFESKYQ